MIADLFSLSFKNLRHRGLRSWLTMLGIFIGIAAVVALISLGNGLKDAVNSQFGVSSTEVITVQAGGLSGYGPPGSLVVNPLTVQDAEAIERLGSVERAVPRVIESGKLEFNDRVIFGFATNILEGDDRKFIYDQLEVEAEVGRLLKDGDNRKVVLGNNFYTNKVGLEKVVRPGDTVLVQDEKFEVVGILEKKGSFIFDNIVMINEDPMQELFDYGDDVDVIAVKVRNSDLMDIAKEDIERLLRKERGVKVGEEDFEVSTPDAQLATVNQVLTGVQIFVLLIAAVSILVGSVGIVNTMTTSVLERRKEIGIMKAVGAKNSTIFYLFLIESGLLGLVGGIVGVIVGSGIGFLGTQALNSFLGAETTPSFDIPLILLTLLGSFLIGSISGVVPALQAAQQKPIEAIRGT